MGKMAPNRRPKGNRRHPLPPFPHFHFALIFAVSLAFSAFLFQNGAEGSIEGWRMRRQVNVTSSGQVKGIGNQTDASAANNLWKKEDGTVGANGSSIGIAQGLGNSNLMSSSNAVVGGQKVEGAGISMANGTNTKSGGQTASNVNGNQMTLQNIASGVATGTGNSQVAASGAGSLMNGNQSSLYSGRNTYGEAGSTGNQMSFAESNVGQTLSWSSILVTLEALSISKGENNSQANFNLQGGSTSNGIKISGLVSGVNDKGGGSTFSEAEGTGTLNNRTASMNSALIGAVNATSGGSKLVGASSLSSNGSSNPGSIDSFGDLILNGTGKSMGGLLSNSSVNPDGSVRGVVGVQGMGNGANKSISVNDGVRVGGDGASQSAAIGQGNIQGMGNQAANGSSFVLTNYQTGQGANMVVGSQGESKAQNGTPSDLRINNQGNFINASQAITNASSNAMGKVTGDQSAVSGQAIMDLGGKSQSGNSSIVATGGGKGSSSALTDTNLSLAGPGGGAPRNSAVKGSVDANGDQTFVLSSSNVSDRNGLQSLSNYQNATVSGKGSSQAQASNVAVLKRRKRRWAMHHFNMEKLAEIIGGNK